MSSPFLEDEFDFFGCDIFCCDLAVSLWVFLA